MSDVPVGARMRTKPRWRAGLAAALVLALCVPARAETRVDLTLARALFEEGVGLAESGDWSAAADRFERAYAIKATAGVAYNLASALVALQRFVHASEVLDRALRDETADAALHAECEALRASLQPRIARLRVSIAGSVTESTELWVDDDRWPRPAWGVASPMDPGPHVARRLEEGREIARLEVVLAEGEQREVELASAQRTPLPLVGAPRPTAVSTPELTRSRSDRPLYKNPWLWTSVGVVVVTGVVVAVTMASHGSSARTEEPVSGNTGDGVIRW